ncbi:MAG: preprotein translocase subunit SecG, partial [Phycisphaeraceae bacterium]|nr:preprotein translocase subunit SecG [Phycisphaeraceae bacterium]
MLVLGGILVSVLAILAVAVSVLLILLILIQKPRGGGLSAAFGGGGAVQTAFGSKVGDVLTWATVVFFV